MEPTSNRSTLILRSSHLSSAMERDAPADQVSDTMSVATQSAMEEVAENMSVDTENVMDDSVAADLDSQPLNDLGVSVMDQDVLERNVAAQVCYPWLRDI